MRKAIEVGIKHLLYRTASMSYNLCRTPPYLLTCLLSILFFKTRYFLDSFDGWFVFHILTNFLLTLLLTILLNVFFCQIRWEWSLSLTSWSFTFAHDLEMVVLPVLCAIFLLFNEILIHTKLYYSISLEHILVNHVRNFFLEKQKSY